jgi:hypothetical protein
MATRSRPAQSIDILRETWSTYLDPSLNPPEIMPWRSKCLINACMDYPLAGGGWPDFKLYHYPAACSPAHRRTFPHTSSRGLAANAV